MQSEAKISCYQELYAKLKEADTLSDFGWPSEKEHLDFYFNAGSTKITFRIFSNKDLMQLRSETIRAEQTTEENIQIARDISHNFYGVFGTAYDNKIILNLSVPFPSISDDAAKQLIIDKTNYFINMILYQLEKEFVNKLKEEKEEAERIVAEEEKNKKRKLNFFPIRKSPSNVASSAKKKEENSDYGNTLETVNQDMIVDEVGTENSLDYTDTSGTKSIENRINFKEDAIENNLEKTQTTMSETQNLFNLKEPVIIEIQQNDAIEAPKQEDKENVQEENQEILEENKNLEVKVDENLSVEENQDVKVELEKNIESVPRQNENEKIKALELLDGQYDPELEISAKKTEKVSELYTSMNRAFSIREEQLDYREKMLADQKHLLDCTRSQLQIESEEIKKKKDEIKIQEDKLKNNWEQYHKIKKKQENKGINLEEREKRISSLESETEKKEDKIKKELQEIEEQKISFIKQKSELDESWKEYKEKTDTLKDYEERLANVKQELSDHEMKINLQKRQIKVEQKAIEDKLADLKETEEMISQMKKEVNIFDLSKNTEKLESLQEEREELLREKKKLISENMELKEMIDSIQDDLINKVAVINQMTQVEADMKQQLQLMQDKLNSPKDELNTEKLLQLEDSITKLNAQKQEMVTCYENKIAEINDKYDSLSAEYRILQERDQTEDSQNLIETLSQGGYIVCNEIRDNHAFLTFSLGGCKIYIDEETRIVEIEKEVRRNYTKQLLDLNEKNYKVGFFMGKGKVYCRFVYNDIVKELRDTIAIMVKFR